MMPESQATPVALNDGNETRAEHVANLVCELDHPDGRSYLLGYVQQCLKLDAVFTVRDLECCISSWRSAARSAEA